MTYGEELKAARKYRPTEGAPDAWNEAVKKYGRCDACGGAGVTGAAFIMLSAYSRTAPCEACNQTGIEGGNIDVQEFKRQVREIRRLNGLEEDERENPSIERGTE